MFSHFLHNGNKATKQDPDFVDVKKKLYKDRAEGFHMKSYRFSVIVEKDKDGYYAFAPDLQGCYSQGDSYEEVIENIRDVIRLHIEDLVGSGENIDVSDSVSLTSLEVAV